MRALAGKISLRRSALVPLGRFAFSGPVSAHATKLMAIPFIMIVVTTSWAPVFTFKTAGTAAKSMPPAIAASRTAGRCRNAGRKSRASAAALAITMANRY